MGEVSNIGSESGPDTVYMVFALQGGVLPLRTQTDADGTLIYASR